MLKDIAIASGIASLCLAYLLFTYQQLFSPYAMLAILILPVLSLLLFLFSDTLSKKPLYLVLAISLVLIISLLSLAYIHAAPNTYLNVARVFLLVTLASSISLLFIYFAGKVHAGRFGFGILYTLLLIILGSALAYISMYGFSNIQWNGVDELAANYYSAYLTLHGVNPYTSSMQPIYNARHVFPTVLLNGSYEDFYAYPALSFLAYIPFVAMGIGSYSLMPFIALLIFFVISAAAIIYIHSGRNLNLFIPLSIWLIACYSLAGVSNVFIVSIFVVLAYIFAKRSFLSGIFLGIAASVTQLAWFALPFFYIMTFNRKRGLGMQIFGTVVSFLLINAVFIILSPSAFIRNIFGILGTHSLVFFGQNIAQFFYTFYPVSQAYLSILSITVLLFSMLIYYLYPKSARLLIALAPIFIFFLAWRNISIYGLAYIPLLLAVYYSKGGKDEIDRIKDKRYIVYGILLIIIVFSIFAIYSHNAYAANKLISINKVYPIIGISSYGYSLNGFIANVTNNANHNETITFYIISRDPNNEAYVLGSLLPQLAANSARNYTVNFSLPLVDNKTRIIIFAFSKDYITSNVIALSQLK